METILCAAIHYIHHPTYNGHTVINADQWPGVVLCGYRHGMIITQYKVLTGKRTGPSNSTQGFLTSKNRFVDRVEARKIHLAVGGTAEFPDELYSEDLY